MISLYQGMFAFTYSRTITDVPRCRHNDHVSRPIRKRVPEHCCDLIHRSYPERTYHGCIRDHYMVSFTLPHRSIVPAKYHIVGIYTWLSPRSLRFAYTWSAWYSSPNTLVCLLSLQQASPSPQFWFQFLDLSFVISPRFAWKVAVIVAISAFPLYIIKLIRSRIAPAASSKLL